MRILCGMMIVTLSVGVAYAGRSVSPPTATPQTSQAAGAAQSALTAQPRLTTDDYRGFMKTVGTTYPAMRMHLTEGKTAEAAKDAELLAMTFGNVERFWTQNKKADAIKLAQQARMYAIATAGAATAGDATKATMSATNMQGMCTQCHGMYREMDPTNPGGFRIKPGVIAGS